MKQLSNTSSVGCLQMFLNSITKRPDDAGNKTINTDLNDDC